MSKSVYSQKNLVLRPCSYCLHNELRYIELVVLGIGVVSGSRNQTARGIFKEIKLSGEMDSQSTYCESLCVFLMQKGQI